MTCENHKRFVISVLVSDRVGILRDIVAPVTDLGAAINGISQTVVEGYFTVILTATASSPIDARMLTEAIERNFPRGEAAITVRIFLPAADAPAPVSRERYFITIGGPDTPDVLKLITAFLAEKDINIDDWHMETDGSTVTHIGEISVPSRLDIKQVQDELRQRLETTGLASTIQHENIFRATNEIGAIAALVEDKGHHV